MLEDMLSNSLAGCYALNKMRYTEEVHGAYKENWSITMADFYF